MEKNQKPEWFELADNDQPVDRKKSAPKRNIALILAGVLVLPMGAGLAFFSRDNQPATAVQGLTLAQGSPTANGQSGSVASEAIVMPTGSRDDDDEYEDDDEDDDEYRTASVANYSQSSPVATNSSKSELKQSSAAAATILPPTKKADDDDDDEDEDDDHGRDHDDDDDEDEDDD
jgi:hypothetical protein